MEIGLQLFSVRDELQKDYLGTLEKLAEIGFRNLEMALHDVKDKIRINDMDTSELKSHLDRLNLKVVSTHVGLVDSQYWDEVINFNLEIGSEAVVCPMAFMNTKEEVLDLSAKLNEYGKRCREKGLDFYYHNHFHEFKKFDGEYAMDIVLANTNPEYVKMEFDTYWGLRAGLDPIEYLQKLGDRCDFIHQKDIPGSVDPVNIFDVVGDADITIEQFMQFGKPENFAEIGEGVMNINEIVAEAKKLGSKYIFVEQDSTTKNQLESVAISFKNLKEILG